MSDAENYDGLTREQAVALCVRRADELGKSEVHFVGRVCRAGRPMNGPEQLRLLELVRRLRQGLDFSR